MGTIYPLATSSALAHPSRWHGAVPLSLEEFTYGFVNTFSLEDAKAAYEKYAVPETGQIFYEAGFANSTFTHRRRCISRTTIAPPLLIVGATKDRTVPASVARKQYEKHGKSAAQTDYIEFGRPHLVMAADGWEEVAAAIETWVERVLAPAPARELTT